jgi:hypothetical protein
MAQGWAEVARAMGSLEPISPEFRLAAEIRPEILPRQSAAATLWRNLVGGNDRAVGQTLHRRGGRRDHCLDAGHELRSDLFQARKLAAASRQEHLKRGRFSHSPESEFLSRAWAIANDRARELGWIK